jgi:hypothetical protein
MRFDRYMIICRSMRKSCCRYEHPSAEHLKSARAEWLQARKHRRKLVSWVEGNPHAFEAAKKGRRAAILADWLVTTFGKEQLNRGSGIMQLTQTKRPWA